jgi:hypothetical protein
LSKIGAFVRQRARSSLRRRKKASKPGSPPSVHSSDSFATLKNILFAYDADTKSVVVGPVALRGGHGVAVPGLHEFGGSTRVNEYQLSGGLWTRVRLKRATIKATRTVPATYPSRPYMGPAEKAERGKFTDAFKGSFKG